MTEPIPIGPFERVDEAGQVNVRCPTCAVANRIWNHKAFERIRDQRFGRIRLVLQYPWVALGAAKFLFRHRECIKDWRP